MHIATYKLRLADFQTDLKNLLQKREELEVQFIELDAQIEHLEKMIRETKLLCGEPTNPEDLTGLGFTDACRQLLKLEYKYMDAVEVRDALERRGYDLRKYTNALASVHTVLKRLLASGEIESKTEGLKTLYRWKPNRFPRLRRGFRVRRRLGIGSLSGVSFPYGKPDEGEGEGKSE
jgi:chromosome segregation ATPase